MAKFKMSNDRQINDGVRDDLKGQHHSGSLDANKLYNKITPTTAEKFVKKSVLKSKWSIASNTRELKIFLATNMNDDEINDNNLRDVIPRRRSNQGRSPKFIGAEMIARPNKPGESKFVIETETMDIW